MNMKNSQKFSHVDIFFTTVFTITFVLQIILMFFLEPIFDLPFLTIIGWIIWGFSIYFAVIPFLIFKKRGDVEQGKSYIHTKKVVKNGAYAIVRHPQYLGGILFSISITLWNPVWVNIILTLIIIILTYQWTYSEDRMLIEKFGEDYTSYKKKVPRLNPLLGIIKYFFYKKM